MPSNLRVKTLRSARAILNPALVKMTSRASYDASDALVVAGAPRSGTTWLAELVQRSVPDSATCFEPLHLRYMRRAVEAGYFWDTYVPEDRDWPEGEAYMRDVLQGKAMNSWTASHTSCASCWRPRRWIVKFVRANLMLGWLHRRFGLGPIGLIMRHPCATVASQLHLEWKARHIPAFPTIYKEYPKLRAYVDTLESPVEYMAANWCLLHWVPLRRPLPYPFHIVTYEGLVANGASELGSLLEQWGYRVPEEVETLLSRPSLTTGKGAAVRTGSNPLHAWKSRLSSEQTQSILAVVEAFGLDFYTEDAEPDYDRLRSDPTPAQTWT